VIHAMMHGYGDNGTPEGIKTRNGTFGEVLRWLYFGTKDMNPPTTTQIFCSSCIPRMLGVIPLFAVFCDNSLTFISLFYNCMFIFSVDALEAVCCPASHRRNVVLS
jgi:hypothetical protein